MAVRSNSDTNHIIVREPYYIPGNEPGVIRSAGLITPRTSSTPARRVVVVRNPRNPQVDQGPVYVDDVRRSNTIDRPPIITDGVSVLFINQIFYSI